MLTLAAVLERRRIPIMFALFAVLAVNAGAQTIRLDIPPAMPLAHGADTAEVMVIGDVMMHTRQLE